ncbi:MAG TPA: hypothetical protein VMU50_20390 [Polyangia bacterium]|nr:hypothetical protein [Polyangia bacterium]
MPLVAAVVAVAGCVTPRDVPVDPGDGGGGASTDGRDLPLASDAAGSDRPGGGDGAPVACAADEHDCAGACFKNDELTSCGACGHDCTTLPNIKAGVVTCTAGKCMVPTDGCAAGRAHCTTNPDDICETDLGAAASCGGCGIKCPAGTPLCTGVGATFTCVASCLAPTPDRCGASCVDLSSNLANCGTCGQGCSFANADAACSGGACMMVKCKDGYGDCTAAPGCETALNTSDHCGSCNPCAANLKCDAPTRTCVDICTGGGSGNASHCCGNADCPANLPVCSNHVCVGKAVGATCASGGECAGGACVEGVCCNNTCPGKCSSCLMTNTGKPDGTCAPVKAGLNHGNDCLASDATTCGLDGKCDGAGACRMYGAEAICAPEACSDGPSASTYSPARTCDGHGACGAGTTTNCGGVYRCAGTKCRVNCSVAQDCVSAAYCSATTCITKKQEGELCSANVECTLGACSGRCCSGCTCTQPSPGNVLKNPGFDKDVSGWMVDTGTVYRETSDSDGCPYSGSLATTGASQVSQCVTTPLDGTYNFGARILVVSGGAVCGVRFYPAAGCQGDELVDDELNAAQPMSGWQAPAPESSPPTVQVSGANSVLFFCVTGDGVYIDQPYVTKIPGKY